MPSANGSGHSYIGAAQRSVVADSKRPPARLRSRLSAGVFAANRTRYYVTNMIFLLLLHRCFDADVLRHKTFKCQLLIECNE